MSPLDGGPPLSEPFWCRALEAVSLEEHFKQVAGTVAKGSVSASVLRHFSANAHSFRRLAARREAAQDLLPLAHRMSCEALRVITADDVRDVVLSVFRSIADELNRRAKEAAR